MGVVTSFEYQAQPVEDALFFAFVTYPIEDAQQVLSGFHDFMQSAPATTSPIAIIWTFEHSEPFPQEVWGKQFVGIAAPYFGPVEEGERVLQPLRELATPLLDMSEPIPYLALQHLFDADYPKGRHYYWKSSYLRDLGPDAISKLIELGAKRPSQLSSVDIWSLGGAIGRVDRQATPINHRDARYLIGIEANWDGAEGDAANIAWTREAAAALTPFSTGGSYLNFEDVRDADAVAKSHGANLSRLVAIKQKYDPENLFRSRRGLVD
jgi:hypothetical protein